VKKRHRILAAAATGTMGDVNGFNQTQADINCSGAIDMVDALLIARKYVGLISNFPCCASDNSVRLGSESRLFG
jgi:hypothetical protein